MNNFNACVLICKRTDKSILDELIGRRLLCDFSFSFDDRGKKGLLFIFLECLCGWCFFKVTGCQ